MNKGEKIPYIVLGIATFLLLCVLGLKKDYQAEDINRDGVVDIKDLLRVQKEIVEGK